jgi:hypothetical protein
VYNFLSTGGYVSAARFKELGLSRPHWHPAITDYYRFVLARPQIDGILCALQSPAQLTRLGRALESGPLTGEEAQYIRDLADVDRGVRKLAQ